MLKKFMSKKKSKWRKPRHTLIQRVAKFLLYPIVKIKYGIKITKTKEKRQRLILANHQTDFDQFFVAYGYPAPIYYLASEDIFSNGFISKLLRYAVNPIPIKKQATDLRAVMNCLSVAKEGGTIAIFPEGNRTFSGTTEYMSVAIVKLVKALKLPVSFFKIEGGYGVHPRWSNKVRKGKMRAYTSKILEPEEFLDMPDEQLYELIKSELFVDDRKIAGEYKSKRSAEYLERAIYVCPYCGVAEFESDKNKIKCLSCGREIEYSADKKLSGVGFDFPFDNVKDWYDYQGNFVREINIQDYIEKPIFKNRARFSLVRLYKSKKIINKNAEIVAFGDRLNINGQEFFYKDISAISVLGRNKLNIYHGGAVYQIKSGKRFNAIKYVNIVYHYKNVIKGETNGQFLGL